MGSFRLYAAILVGFFAVFSYFDNSCAADQTTIDEMKLQLEKMQNMIMRQQEEIKSLKVMLDNESEPVKRVTDHTVSHHVEEQNKAELDKVVDERIKEFFESEDGKEHVAHSMPLEMGYDKGFFVKTHDEKFSMKTNAMLQFRYTYDDANREDDESSFRIRRGRLSFTGNAFDEHLKYYTQVEMRSTGSKDGSKSVELLDFFGTYEKYEFAQIMFGQWKVPFNTQFMTSSSKLQMIDRSEADDVFNLGRQLGVAIKGELFHEHFEYYLGFWNGNFRNERRNDNNQHLWILRAEYDPLGRYGNPESDYEYTNKPLLLLAGAIAFDNEEDQTLELAGIGEFEADDIDKTQVVGEIGFKFKGFSFLSEYYWRKRHVDSFRGHRIEDANLIDQGFFTQAGYFIIPKKLEITGRYSMVSFDDILEEDSIIESTFGANYFFSGRRHKLQFNAIRLDEESHEDGHDAIDYHYRLQYQVKF